MDAYLASTYQTRHSVHGNFPKSPFFVRLLRLTFKVKNTIFLVLFSPWKSVSEVSLS